MTEQEEYGFVQSCLGAGEYIRWKGKPGPGSIFAPGDIFFVPFSVAWCGFAIFWEVTAITGGAPFFFCLFGVPFVMIGLYMVAGRFFWRAHTLRKTRYVITNKRIFRARGNRVDILQVQNLPPMKVIARRDGSGSVYFRDNNPGRNRGNLNFPGGEAEDIALENIPDVIQVQKLILSLQ